MYHRIGKGKHANSLETFEKHLQILKDFPVVLPGEPLRCFSNSICLTFDDAFFDFYHYVFPLLKKYELKALVGVPVRYILDDTSLSPEERLAIPYTLAMQDEFFTTKAPFCTWKEIREMADSGYVEIASHSFRHGNLTFPFMDLHKEVVESKTIIEKKINRAISSFIYPFGRYNKQVHDYVMKSYDYAFRIGSAINFTWTGGPLCRISADNSALRPLLSKKNLALYYLKGLLPAF